MRAKQVIVIRRDLKMKPGKIAAQASHASIGSFLQYISRHGFYGADGEEMAISFHSYKGQPVFEWLQGSFFKICLGVNSEEELLDIYKKVQEAGLVCALITDQGHTVFNGVPTNTCLGIGPVWDEEIDSITGHLKLF